MPASLPFPVYDADHHLYEPAEAFQRHLPDRYKRDFYFVEKDGRTKLVINGMLSEFIPNPTFEVAAWPGGWEKWFRASNDEGLSRRELQGKAIRPPQAWRTGEQRLAELDEQGVHAALIFPTLASVENGATWVEPLLMRFDRARGQMPHAFKTHPRDQFDRHVWVAPFYEDDVSELKSIMQEERILFGSDFPHPEGLANPLQYPEEFGDCTPEEVEMVFSTNLKGLLEGAPL